MIKKILLLFSSSFFLISAILLLFFSSKTHGQASVTRIHTDWGGYWTANGPTSGTNRPNRENNLIGFEWNGTTYSTGVDDASLISRVPTASILKFRALKIQSLSHTSSTYFLQGSMIDGSATGRTLMPALGAGTSTPEELASRLTDGVNGLALGTGIANIATNKVFFKVGTGNLNVFGLNDNIPDLIVTQVAEPGGTPDVFRFVDTLGNLVGNAVSINFGSVQRVGSYSLDLFNASNGAIAGFSPQETRDIRILGYDTSAFGIDASNAAQVDRFEVSFSGTSDCAFIAFNANSLKKAELSLVKSSTFTGCGIAGDIINYTFVVTNTGDVSVTNVVVTDPLPGVVISGTQNSTLAVGATVTLTGTYTITAADVAAGRVTNQAKVTGLDPATNIVEDLSGQANGNNIATVTNLLTAPTGITGISAICRGDSTVLTVTGGAAVGTGATIEWFAGTCSGTPIGTGNSITVSPTSNTTYYVRYKNNCAATTCISQLVRVNPLPTVTAATQPTFACVGSPAIINLTGLLANSTSTITYTINGGSIQTATGVVANASGVGNFTTGNLTAFDNGKILKITGVTTTSATPACTTVFSIDINLVVNPDSGSISLNGVSHTSNSTTTYCASTSALFSVAAIVGATTYTWIVPTGWTITSGQGTTTLRVTTGTDAQSGTVSVMANNLFCPSNLGVTLSTIAPIAPTVTPTALTCAVPSGTITITSPAPAAGTVYTLTGINPAVAAVTNTSGEFTGLAAGDYVVTCQQGSGCVSTPTATISLAALVTKTWNGAWSPAPGVEPTINDYVVFAGDYDKLGSVDACSCKVNTGATVTVKSGDVFVIENGLTVEGDMIFENGASLVQHNPLAANVGSITYKRSSSALKAFDYVYWSSPLKNQTIETVFPGSNKMWFYQENLWIPATSTMIPAKGYIVRYSGATTQNAVFVGEPNNGDYLMPVQGLGNNLIGNPYPSAISADDFMIANITVIADYGSLSFWTHNTARTENGTDTKYIYATDDYAMYNLSGSTAAGSGGVPPDGNIASGQSFFVPSKVGSVSFNFTNSMRITDIESNSQFFKQSSTKKGAKGKIEKNRVWLNLTNDEGAFKQLLVGYIQGATNSHDKLYDGKTLDGNAFVDFYSNEGMSNYTIQARGLPFNAEDEVPLGFKTTIAGTFKIAIDKTDGFLTNQAIYLEDKTTNTVHDLKSGAYSFTTAKGEFKDRFVLRYNDSKLGTGDFDPKAKGVIVSVKNRQIKINSFDQTFTTVKLFDLKGSLVYEKNKVNKNEFIIDNLTSATQFMIVMVQLEDGKWVNKEIIFHD